MKIQAVSNFNNRVQFGNFSTDGDDTPRNAKMPQRKNKNFYAMSNSEKLDKIYNMLLEQKKDLVTLSKNQYKIQHCNSKASKMIFGYLSDSFIEDPELKMCFDYNRIDVLS